MRFNKSKLLVMMLVCMFSVNVAAKDIGELGTHITPTIEGNGFATQEEAISTYIEGFMENDFEKMLSAFAVETFVDSFNLESYVEWLKVINPNFKYVPTISDMSHELNIEMRRSSITQMIFYHYTNLTKCELYYGENAGITWPYKENEMSISEFLGNIYTFDDSQVLSEINFEHIYIHPDELTEGKYSHENNRENLQKKADAYGADEFDSVAALLTVNGEEYILCMGTARYGDKWYLFEGSGILGSLMGLSTTTGGLIAVDEL